MKYTKIAVTASPSAPEKFANTEIIVSKGETTANTITSANELSFKGKSLTVNTTENAGHGLAISTTGTDATKTATVTFTDSVTLTKGVLTLAGNATSWHCYLRC